MGVSAGFGRSSQSAGPRGAASKAEWWDGKGDGAPTISTLGSFKVTAVSEITLSHPEVPSLWPEVMFSTLSQLSVCRRTCTRACGGAFPTRRCSGQLWHPGLLEVQVSLAPTLPCPAGITAQPQSPGLAPGSLCAGVTSEARFPVPSLPPLCLQGGRSNRMQITKPKSYSSIIPRLRQMRFIAVLGGASKCQAGGSTVHPAGPVRAGVVGEVPRALCSSPDPLLSPWLTPKAPQESLGGDQGSFLGYPSNPAAFHG